MDCKECNEKLSQYLDHELSPKETEALRQHLEKCKPCQEEHEKYAATLDLVCKLKCVDAPTDFHTRFMCRFERECKLEESKYNFWGFISLGAVAAAAVVLMFIVLQKPTAPVVNPDMTAPQAAKAETGGKIASAQKVAIPDGNGTNSAKDQNPAGKSGARAESVASSIVTAKDKDINDLQPPEQSVAEKASLPNALLKTVAVSSDYAPVGGQIPSQARMTYHYQAAAQPRLIRQTGDISGDDSAVKKPEQLVLHNPAEMAALWKKASLGPIAQPKIDWRTQMLGAIFLGHKNSRGFEIKLLESQGKENQWLVKYKVTAPAPGGDATESSPFLIFVLPQSRYPVVFTEE